MKAPWNWNIKKALRDLFGRSTGRRKREALRPQPPTHPAAQKPTQPSTPGEPAPIVLPPMRHHSIEMIRALVLSGQFDRHLVPHDPEPFVDAVLAHLRDPHVGRHKRPNGRWGGGVIAINVPSQGKPYTIIDIVQGGESASPRAAWTDQTRTMEDGSTFDPVVLDQVPRLSTLPRITVQGTQFVAGGQPWRWIGATSFDLPSRIRAYGDLRWADWLAEQGFTLARLVPASLYRTPRTLADGIRDLPRALAELHVRGLYAEVVIGVDTKPYGMSRAEFFRYASDVSDICRGYSNALVEIANENTHSTQADWLRDAGFLRDLVALCHGVTCSAGSSHGGESHVWPQGDYLTVHAARSRTPEDNGASLSALMHAHGKPVVDDEPLGTAEQPKQGSRTNDPAFAERQARASRQHGIAATCHLEAGLTANVDVLGTVQREAARRFVAAMKR